MRGIAKVLDELGLMILTRDIELQAKQAEIDDLKKKIEAIEEYIDFCENQR